MLRRIIAEAPRCGHLRSALWHAAGVKLCRVWQFGLFERNKMKHFRLSMAVTIALLAAAA
jgi:hypothetical protein